MDKTELDRLRTLAGNPPAVEAEPVKPQKTVQAIMETYVPVAFESEEAEKAKRRALDKADDEASKKKVSLKKAPWEESVEESDDEDGDKEEVTESDDKEEVSSCCSASIDSHDGKHGRCSDCGEMASVVTTEAAKPDFADIDDDGDKKEPAKKAAKDKKEMTETQQMREWANSVYKQYDDRGHYQEQPDGETVDLSLRRYLNADPMKVQIEESIKPSDLAKAYRDFKGK